MVLMRTVIMIDDEYDDDDDDDADINNDTVDVDEAED